MNKESIYRIIGYRGEYTNNVKKALRKLLKENHPDNKGNGEVFKLVNEVKKELENNKVSFKYDFDNKEIIYDDIDYDFCQLMINNLEKKKSELEDELKKKYEINNNLLSKYKDLYRQSIDKAGSLLNKDNDLKNLKNIKIISIILLIILVISFIYAIINNNLIIFIIFGIMCFISIILIKKYFMIFNEISSKSEKKVKRYIRVIEKMKNTSNDKDELNTEIIKLERSVKKIENDLRFYKNLLK